MITVDNNFFDFVDNNMDKEPDKLLFSYSGKCSFDLKLAVSTIEGRKKMIKKVPEWGENREIVYPALISVEQCSSLQTAIFKQRFFKDASLVFDLTGGLGIDSYYISKVCKEVVMFEKDSLLCAAAVHNFKVAGASNIKVQHYDVTPTTLNSQLNKHIRSKESVSGIKVYIDPSRRKKGGKRIYSITDYEPDLLKIKADIQKNSSQLLVKISPMEDVSQTLKLVEGCRELYIISVNNECKELLLLIDPDCTNYKWENVPLEAWNLKRDGQWESLRWTIEEETNTKVELLAPEAGMYLYEPNSSLIKGGAFKVTSERFSLGKADKSSHLYFSKEFRSNFQGKSFKIIDIYNFGKGDLAEIRGRYPKASISVRNFPLPAEELRKKLKIEEGEEFHIFGTTLPLSQKKLIVCKKV